MSIESVSYITPTLADFLKIGKSPEIEGLFSDNFSPLPNFRVENTNNSYSVNFYPGIYLNTK